MDHLQLKMIGQKRLDLWLKKGHFPSRGCSTPYAAEFSTRSG